MPMTRRDTLARQRLRARSALLALMVAAAAALAGCTNAAVPPSESSSSAAPAATSQSAAPPSDTSASDAPDGDATAPADTMDAQDAPAFDAGGASASAPLGRVAGAQPYDATQLDPRVTQASVRATIAVPGWSARVRPAESVTERIKRALMKQHGYTDRLSDYELDHFIPLGVGGSSNLSNLWLEPIADAKKKDRDELIAHNNVASGKWTLAQGQQYIRNKWRIHYAR